MAPQAASPSEARALPLLTSPWRTRYSDILAGAVGSPAIAAWIAEAAFWCLLVYGLATGEMNLKRIATFLLMWLAGRIGLPYVSYEPVRAMFSSFVAALESQSHS